MIRVGLADDQQLVRAGFGLVLDSQDDIAVQWQAADGQEACELAESQPVDIILMDVQMPVLDGLAATRAIRALADPASQTPILAVTAEAMPEDAARCLSAGMDGHLAKPIQIAELAAALTRWLSSDQPPAMAV